MFTRLTSIVVDANGSSSQEMSDFLVRHGVGVVAQLLSPDQLRPFLARCDAPQVVVVHLGANPQETLRKVSSLVRDHPAVSFFALSSAVEPGLLMEAMRVGIREFIPLPVNEDRFVAGLARVSQLGGTAKRARVINVIPSIGGCGASTIACNIAVCLAKAGKTALIDLDLVRGTVASSLDLRPRFTLADLMASAEKLDHQLLENALTVHEPSGLSVLPRPNLPEEIHSINQASFSRLLDAVGRSFDYVVLDSVMSVDPVYASAIHAADLNLILMQMILPSARNTEHFVKALRRSGVEPGRIRIVVNRHEKGAKFGIEMEQVERQLGMKISWLIPNDYKNAIDAINYGEPVVLRAPRAEISASLRGLTQQLIGKTVRDKES